MKTKKQEDGFLNFNINDRVWVRLTKRGHKIYRDNYDKLAAGYGGKLPFAFSRPKEDRNGWSCWQAWQLMEEFGEHVSMGRPVPFDTDIRISLVGSNK